MLNLLQIKTGFKYMHMSILSLWAYYDLYGDWK